MLIKINYLPLILLSTHINKGKVKAIPLQAWRGPEGSRRLRLPDFVKYRPGEALRVPGG